MYTAEIDRSSTRVERLASTDTHASVQRLENLARLLDSAVRIPGTDLRIGVDALIGIVPVAGDLVSKAISAYLIMEARKLGVSRWTIARMAANTTLDTVVGAIPIVGDAFDLMYRANEKNIALLKRHIERHGLPPRAGGPVIDGRGIRVG